MWDFVTGIFPHFLTQLVVHFRRNDDAYSRPIFVQLFFSDIKFYVSEDYIMRDTQLRCYIEDTYIIFFFESLVSIC